MDPIHARWSAAMASKARLPAAVIRTRCARRSSEEVVRVTRPSFTSRGRESGEVAVADQKTPRQLAHGKPFTRFARGHIELRQHVETRQRAGKIFAQTSAHARLDQIRARKQAQPDAQRRRGVSICPTHASPPSSSGCARVAACRSDTAPARAAARSPARRRREASNAGR